MTNTFCKKTNVRFIFNVKLKLKIIIKMQIGENIFHIWISNNIIIVQLIVFISLNFKLFFSMLTCKKPDCIVF